MGIGCCGGGPDGGLPQPNCLLGWQHYLPHVIKATLSWGGGLLTDGQKLASPYPFCYLTSYLTLYCSRNCNLASTYL